MPTLSMSAAAAEARRRAMVDPIVLELNLEEPFRCVPAVPALPFLTLREQLDRNGEMSAEPDTATLRAAVEAISAFVREAIVPEERERFDAGRAAQSDAERCITDETLLELFRPLVEAYTAVPTPPASPSSAGQEPVGSASATTAETHVLVELD